MKTREELNTLKEEYETLNSKLHELTDEELAQVTGGDEIRYVWPTAFSPIFPRVPDDPDARDTLTSGGCPRNRYTDGFTVDEGKEFLT